MVIDILSRIRRINTAVGVVNFCCAGRRNRARFAFEVIRMYLFKLDWFPSLLVVGENSILI